MNNDDRTPSRTAEWFARRDTAARMPARRKADDRTFEMPSRPADRSRNFQGRPQSVPRKNYR